MEPNNIKRLPVLPNHLDVGMPDIQMSLSASNPYDVHLFSQLKVGDEVELAFAAGSLKFRVLALKETVKKDEAAGLYEIL